MEIKIKLIYPDNHQGNGEELLPRHTTENSMSLDLVVRNLKTILFGTHSTHSTYIEDSNKNKFFYPKDKYSVKNTNFTSIDKLFNYLQSPEILKNIGNYSYEWIAYYPNDYIKFESKLYNYDNSIIMQFNYSKPFVTAKQNTISNEELKNMYLKELNRIIAIIKYFTL